MQPFLNNKQPRFLLMFGNEFLGFFLIHDCFVEADGSSNILFGDNDLSHFTLSHFGLQCLISEYLLLCHGLPLT